MFTGIVTGLGEVLERRFEPTKSVERLSFAAPGHTEGLALGGSIAVNGVCVSAVDIDGDRISVELIPETLKRTALGQLSVGDGLNLERCLPSGARLDGHVVQGHVDGLGELVERDPQDGRHRFQISAELAPYLAEKGSIAVDGVSLTVTAVADPASTQPWFEVGLIPTTLAETTLGGLSIGGAVNLEVDVLAKYTRRMLQFGHHLPDPASQAVEGAAVGNNAVHGAAGEGAEAEGAIDQPADAGSSSPIPSIPQPETPAPLLDPIDVALNELAAGRPVVVVDDADRENEGDIIFPASLATEELMAMTVRYTSGVICVPMTPERAEHLKLPPMVTDNEDPKGTAYTISADAAAGVSTGISAADRALSVRVMADAATTAADLSRPGHLFPLIADPAGVLGRPGHTEAAVDLCRLSGLPEVGVIAELTHDDGRMMRLPALRDFADAHRLALVSIADLIAYRGGTSSNGAAMASVAASWDAPSDELAKLVTPGPVVTLPTDHGVFAAQVWTEHATGHEHMLISALAQAPGEGNEDASRPLIRMHSECVTGDVLGSRRCDCGTQLASALESIQRDGGHLLYLRGHEGRGIGLANKMRAYKLQEQGADTVEANEMLGLAAELRDFTGAAAILHSAGIRRLRLMTNNPVKVDTLRGAGLDVELAPSTGVVHETNLRYLQTKRDRMNHTLDHLQLHEQ
ncbi:3,4-dihydroxy-2-butanone-4-phosphate synthase [Nesterenkonia halotolerans]|uniref:GTP cyclohydrolase-2 n=1 Tax=Nesterenkonia halotolerans TaxID=225325 RepID=A0ABR9J5R0_9MICC|nr:3,4-dihydroxy-2-butanone-4-phosphate synthase [Nesterenkonia halotolerans]MBE1513941.1 3,4-dihydroxy 2-butanone 4-phosphate synthase/GTP cyclohydrolase II [Nesterenkonia halotolerans]